MYSTKACIFLRSKLKQDDAGGTGGGWCSPTCAFQNAIHHATALWMLPVRISSSVVCHHDQMVYSPTCDSPPLPLLTFVLSPDFQESADVVAFPHEVEQAGTTNQGEELCTEGINILCEQPALPTKRDRKPQEQGDGTSHSEESTSALEERREAIKAARESTEMLQGELSELGMVANAEHDHANEKNLLTPRTKTRLVLQALKQQKQQVSHTNNSSKGATSPSQPCADAPNPKPFIFHI